MISRAPARTSVFCILTVLCGCRAPAASNGAAWWVRARFTPADTLIAGIPVRAINATWAKASLIDRSSLPPEAAKDPSGLTDSSVSFRLSGDFNHDKMPDQAMVGVFRTTTGAEGRFLLIVTDSAGRWRMAELATELGEPGFSVLSQAHDTLQWWECMECDVGISLAWNGHQYVTVADDSSDTP